MEAINEDPVKHEQVQRALDLLSSVLIEEKDWVEVKKKIMLMIKPDLRSNFTFRDQKSKGHQPHNEFENKIRKEWKSRTGNWLIIPPQKRKPGEPEEGYL